MSTDELLSMLGNGDPASVQCHIIKVSAFKFFDCLSHFSPVFHTLVLSRVQCHWHRFLLHEWFNYFNSGTFQSWYFISDVWKYKIVEVRNEFKWYYGNQRNDFNRKWIFAISKRWYVERKTYPFLKLWIWVWICAVCNVNRNAYQTFARTTTIAFIAPLHPPGTMHISLPDAAVSTDVSIENLLNIILQQMYYSHRYVTKGAIYDYGKSGDKTRIEWIHDNLGMVCLAAKSVWFTTEMVETFQQIANGRKDAMREFLNQQNAQINDLMAKGLKIINYFEMNYNPVRFSEHGLLWTVHLDSVAHSHCDS